MYGFETHWTRTYFSFAVTRYVSISGFASLVGILLAIATFAVGLKICAITVGTKMYKSVIKKKRKKHDKLVLLAKIP